ncbi:GmrSD restriction endonuclease domain-containing protein [Nostoc sp. PCC 7524]|uniref:GmrSD restriction endonuclease domain-containing protein n=1 Tax=Nostoc sp. (strain ATCC 29411 / PCC 7524) TaxID=28072 RepID=UPI0005A1FF97|nr:DUF262 domain-containing protein [Nostoc sp. PCC 7524]
MKVSTILDQIDTGSISLPAFQRGYVWNRNQVKAFMYSLYREHPVGSLLLWNTKYDEVIDHVHSGNKLAGAGVKLLLDGQQRVTTLYGIIRGEPPKFFEGNYNTFTGLYFNLEEEHFEFYAPLKMNGNPLWVNVTQLMQKGIAEFMEPLFHHRKFKTYFNHLNQIIHIKDLPLLIAEVGGKDKTVDVVAEIFDKVNSGGTKLSKGDLALAKICAEWPNARKEMNAKLKKWQTAGFNFNLDWLLRCVTAATTGKAVFSALKEIDTPTFEQKLQQTEQAIDKLLNLISSRLGLDHDRVLGSRYSFPLMVRYLVQREGKLADYKERDQLLYWYIHTFLWGHYAGSTETLLTKDLAAIEKPDNALDALIAQMMKHWGWDNLEIEPDNFDAWSIGARFYPMLYMMTCVCKARDWEDDVDLSGHILGKLCSLQLHHIFPKSLLSKHGYSRSEVNAIANFTFLTQDTNLKVSNKKPEDYFAHYENKHPGTIASHWIPMDRELWKIENYREFLAARRQLLADAANKFLNSLYSGSVPEVPTTPSILERKVITLSDDDEDKFIDSCNHWVTKQGLPAGESMYELIDTDTGNSVGILDLAWTNGLQEGFSQPVAVLLSEIPGVEKALNQAGYRYFTSLETFQQYVKCEILGIENPVV